MHELPHHDGGIRGFAGTVGARVYDVRGDQPTCVVPRGSDRGRIERKARTAPACSRAAESFAVRFESRCSGIVPHVRERRPSLDRKVPGRRPLTRPRVGAAGEGGEGQRTDHERCHLAPSLPESLGGCAPSRPRLSPRSKMAAGNHRPPFCCVGGEVAGATTTAGSAYAPTRFFLARNRIE